MLYKVRESFDSHLLKREINKGHFEKGEIVEMSPAQAKRFELLLEPAPERKPAKKKKYRIKKDCEIPVLRKMLKRDRALFRKDEEISLDEETAKAFAGYFVEPEKSTTAGGASAGDAGSKPSGSGAVKEK